MTDRNERRLPRMHRGCSAYLLLFAVGLVIAAVLILGCAGCDRADTPLTIADIRESWRQEHESGVESPNIEGQRFSLRGTVESISELHSAYRVVFPGGYMDIYEDDAIPAVGMTIDEIVTIYDARLANSIAVLRGYTIIDAD